MRSSVGWNRYRKEHWESPSFLQNIGSLQDNGFPARKGSLAFMNSSARKMGPAIFPCVRPSISPFSAKYSKQQLFYWNGTVGHLASSICKWQSTIAWNIMKQCFFFFFANEVMSYPRGTKWCLASYLHLRYCLCSPCTCTKSVHSVLWKIAVFSQTTRRTDGLPIPSGLGRKLELPGAVVKWIRLLFLNW